jgi:hypothetical protein
MKNSTDSSDKVPKVQVAKGRGLYRVVRRYGRLSMMNRFRGDMRHVVSIRIPSGGRQKGLELEGELERQAIVHLVEI